MADPLLVVDNLHVRGGGREILRGIDLSIDIGEVHAIMGPNGSGKSTLARVLSGNDAYDDFEEMEIHSTILIDKKGRVHWARSGGEPFGDMDFLVKQLERMNQVPSDTPRKAE